ncbi:MAG: PRC-barrel domain-containing protein [Candidatus Promineifilaceae bacterium]
MLRSIKELIHYKLKAIDGEIGQVNDFYFDEQSWTIRYLIADTGTWLTGRKVLIAPEALKQPEWAEEQFPVALKKEAIENSPSIEADKPVSRQHEIELSEFYGWSPYWRYWSQNPTMGTPILMTSVHPPTTKDIGVDPAGSINKIVETHNDPYLRSINEVRGYHIQALDDEIGHIDDFIVNDETWRIQYMVIDTRNLLPGKKVLIAPTWVTSVEWEESLVTVELHKDTIKNSPEYDPDQPINRSYETVLHDYYGRPYYWTEEGELEPIY